MKSNKEQLININQNYLFLIGLLLVILYCTIHISFLSADPIDNLSLSRGIYTDEGLNTGQVRNYINHGHCKMTDSDNLIKTPAFAAILYPFYKLFGTSMEISRISVLLFFFLTCIILLFNNYWKGMIILFLFIGGFQAHIFQFIHTAMPEMIPICCIVLGIFSLYMYDSKRQNKYLLLTAFTFSLSYFTKIQYIYIVPLPLFYMAFRIIKILIIHTDKKFDEIKQALSAAIIYMLGIGLLSLLYYLLWYRNYTSVFNYVILDQTSNRFPHTSDMWNIIVENYNNIFAAAYTQFYTYTIYLSIGLSFIIYFSTDNRNFKRAFELIFIWFLFEIHKIAIWWLPARYVVGLLFPSMLIIANLMLYFLEIFVNRFYQLKQGKRVIYGSLLGGLMICIICFNAKQYHSYLNNRTYYVRHINQYFNEYSFHSQPMMGAWASTFNWENKAYAITIWREYFNDADVIETFSPKVIITEYDENDSGEAFINRNVNLTQFSDSVKCVEVNQWNLNISWIADVEHNL